jgi:hypothetical protein
VVASLLVCIDGYPEIALLIYRSTLIDEGPLFMDESEGTVEPGRIRSKTTDPVVRVLGAASGAISLVMAALILSFSTWIETWAVN